MIRLSVWAIYLHHCLRAGGGNDQRFLSNSDILALLAGHQLGEVPSSFSGFLSAMKCFPCEQAGSRAIRTPIFLTCFAWSIASACQLGWVEGQSPRYQVHSCWMYLPHGAYGDEKFKWPVSTGQTIALDSRWVKQEPG